MPLVERAVNVLALLGANGIGSRPLVLIGHSMGGLVAKTLLRQSLDSGDTSWIELAHNLRAMVFLATPHSGSGLADWCRRLARVSRPTVAMDDLVAHESHLRELNVWFRNKLPSLALASAVQVYYEKLKTVGILVVDETSADPGVSGVTPIPLDADHVSICKPETAASLVYLRVLSLIAQSLPLSEINNPPPVDYVALEGDEDRFAEEIAPRVANLRTSDEAAGKLFEPIGQGRKTRPYGTPSLRPRLAAGLIAFFALSYGLFFFLGRTIYAKSSTAMCRRISLDPHPTWLSSGVWTKDSSALLLVESSRDPIAQYLAFNGKLQKEIPCEQPNSIQSVEGGYIVEQGSDQNISLSWLPASLASPARTIPLASMLKRGTTDVKMQSLWQWVPFGSSSILGLSDYLQPQTVWSTAFVRFEKISGTQFELVTDPWPDSERKKPYTLGYPFSAVLHGKAYFVLMDKVPKLCEFEHWNPNCFTLPAFQQPDLGRGKPIERLKEFEANSSIAGLYADRKGLYVLDRRPEFRPSTPRSDDLPIPTVWTLSRLDLKSHLVVYSKVIPTPAPHLTVIPGPIDWAFIEKGRAKALWDQEIATMLLVPAAAIENPDPQVLKVSSERRP
jgi:hypothetical protein